ncbi:MAG TPA: G1 family glutamic endopeptidase, partial [Chloroflexota bacterium]
MKRPALKLLTIALFALALSGCGAQGLVGQLPQEVQSRMPRFDNAPSVVAPSGTDQAAIQDVILRGNHEQEQAIATRDASAMQDTAVSAYYQEMAKINQDMLDQGIVRIALASLDWGDIAFNVDGTATATTWETWITEFADGGTDQSRDRNVYTLVQQDGVWKIQTDDHPDDVLSSPVGIRPTAPSTPAPQVPPAVISPQGRGTSANWAGYAATQGTFTSVSGTWTVPQPAMDGTQGADATWVGIGGEHSRDLIQAGTEAAVSSGNRVRYYAWIEMLPDYSKPVPLAVHPGDSVTVSLAQQEPGSWLISFNNHTTGATFNRTVQYQSSLSSAEWIEEA